MDERAAVDAKVLSHAWAKDNTTRQSHHTGAAHTSARCQAWTRPGAKGALAHLAAVQQLWQEARTIAGLPPLNSSQLSSRRGYMLDFYHAQHGALCSKDNSVCYVRQWKAANDLLMRNSRSWVPGGTGFGRERLNPDADATREAGGKRGARLQFSFVRDPLSRFVSGWGEFLWRHMAAPAGSNTAGMATLRPPPIGEPPSALVRRALLALLDAQLPLLLDSCEARNGVGRHSLKMAEHFYPMSGVLSSWRLDFVGRIEHLASEWGSLRRHLASAAPFETFNHSLGQHLTSADPLGHRALLEELLRAEPPLRAAVCVLLRPDYECFGFDPEGCLSGRSIRRVALAKASSRVR